ncbi:hypothetical protein GGX14DRAFT_444647 [Mycena pura]|uniref:Uncharacterized protein n=1 Tax=Mycena pura TaxID=153505 RepID=A0AAD6YCQ3_9AGAR|nr:hypothetical protein GGX14DRAFT_444647 [Mycena pura]
MKNRSSKNASYTPATTQVAKKNGLKRVHSPEKPKDAKAVKKTKKTKDIEPEIAVATTPAPSISEAPKYEGNFDFYFDSASGADFQKRYDVLRQKQIAGKPHGLCYFGAGPSYADSSFETAAFVHPMEEMPIGLALHSITTAPATGISAQVGLLANDCGIATLNGTFTMKRVWAKPDDASIELFEGSVRVKIGYGSMYSSRGFGRGMNNELAFTAIRKRNAKGEEVGLGPRKCEGGPLSHGGGGSGSGSYGGRLFDSDDDLGLSDEESDGEDSDGNVKGSLRWHYRRHKMGIYDY